VRHANSGRADAVPWLEIAAQLGADVPMCLAQRPAVARGRGETLALVVTLPALHAVLVNPGVPLATADVFAAFGRSYSPVAAPTRVPSQFPDLEALLEYMRAHGNALEPAATALLPAIAEVKSRLLRAADCCFAAMSGSGPTCFGVFPTRDTARQAAGAITADKPAWWVEPTILSGAP
jgi:4-diphosphocytidyl-2-C-methyl-D-erythritol kinase